MSEQRLLDLEDDVVELRIDAAEVSSSLNHLAKSVDDLNENVKTLNEFMNRGRGALAVVFVAASLVSALVSALFTFFSNK